MTEVTRRGFMEAAGAALAAGTAGAISAHAGEVQVDKIKILGLCCSPRQGKTTSEALRVCLEEAAKVSDRIETELIELGALKIPAQVAAGIPLEAGEKDDFPALLPRLVAKEVGAIIIGTPVYMGNMSALCKAFIDRTVEVRKQDFAWSGRVGAVLAVGGARNGGQELTVHSVLRSLIAQEMFVVGEGRPTSHWGGTLWNKEDSIAWDEFGLTTTRNLGKRVAEVTLKLRG